MGWRVQELALGALIKDSRVQPRESINLSVVSEYALALAKAPVYREAGLPVDPFPPLVAFHERNERGYDLYWLADGWHRALAADEAGLDTFVVDVREGGVYDAILFAAGANARHGMRRTNRDKHRAVRMLFDHPTVIREGWGNARIAHAAGTSEALARVVRRERELELGLPESRERRGADGKVYSLQLRASPDGPQEPLSATGGPLAGLGGVGAANGTGRVVLYQCATPDCDAVTTEVSWHCASCGSHLPTAGFPPGRGCPVCDATDADAALPVLALIRDMPLPEARSGGGQVPYSPGRLRPSGAVLAYERLATALDLLDGLEVAPEVIAAESPDPEHLRRRVEAIRMRLDEVLRALVVPLGLVR